MPTRFPRRSITETPPVARALRELRQRRPGEHIDLKELVILGARQKAAAGTGADDADRKRELVDEFLALRADERVEAEEGLALHESGWVRSD